MFKRFVVPVALLAWGAQVLLGPQLKPARAETPSSLANPLRTRGSWVADSAGVVDKASEARINNLLSPLERQTGAEVAVVTVRSLEGLTVEQFAGDLLRRWGVGKKGKDNGVLILVSLGDHKARIEVGYGLEAILPDGKTGAILRENLVPAFKQKRFGEGLYATAAAVATVINGGTPITPPAPVTRSSRASSPAGESLGTGAPPAGGPPLTSPNPFPGMPGGNAAGSSPPPAPWPNPQSEPMPSSSGYFPGWLAILLLPLALGGLLIFLFKQLSKPPTCRHCNSVMERLQDSGDAKTLTPAQRFEREIGATEYEVWRCRSCARETVTEKPQTFTAYHVCEQCGNRTSRTRTNIETYPTEWSDGVEAVEMTCDWRECGHTRSFQRALPQLTRSDNFGTGLAVGSVLGNVNNDSDSGIWGSSNSNSDSNSNSSDSGWFSSSNGGSGNDSSSSSSSSSDSSPSYDSGPSDFGGGDSGGGGASSDW